MLTEITAKKPYSCQRSQIGKRAPRKLLVMWRLTAILVLSFSVAVHSQTVRQTVPPSLQNLSSEQLKECLEKADFCGSDSWAISDELIHRLPALSTEKLVACFDNWKICGVGEDQASGWPISDELARRGDPHELLTEYWNVKKPAIRRGIEHVAYHFDTAEVTAFMRRVLAERVEDGELLYWPVNYLAKKCDLAALKQLGTGRYRNQGCMQYESSVKLFGKCQYRPAIPYLVDTAVFDACLNIVVSADLSLHQLYPDAPQSFSKMGQMQTYFCDRAQQEGFKVRCKGLN